MGVACVFAFSSAFPLLQKQLSDFEVLKKCLSQSRFTGYFSFFSRNNFRPKKMGSHWLKTHSNRSACPRLFYPRIIHSSHTNTVPFKTETAAVAVTAMTVVDKVTFPLLCKKPILKPPPPSPPPPSHSVSSSNKYVRTCWQQW